LFLGFRHRCPLFPSREEASCCFHVFIIMASAIIMFLDLHLVHSGTVKSPLLHHKSDETKGRVSFGLRSQPPRRSRQDRGIHRISSPALPVMPESAFTITEGFNDVG